MPNKKISQFTTVGSINSDDVFLINQTGTTNTVTMNTVSAAIDNNISNKYIQKPAIVAGGEVLTYNGSTATWVASAAPVPSGCVMMWTSTTLPDGWIECNGQSTASYPNLAAVCGATVPDLRGEFVRGWDHGKGVDVGRTIKSTQADASQKITGSILTQSGNSQPTGAFGVGQNADGGFNGAGPPNDTITFDSSKVVRTADETRPRNVALMYIIKT
jgi:hypothetical protein